MRFHEYFLIIPTTPCPSRIKPGNNDRAAEAATIDFYNGHGQLPAPESLLKQPTLAATFEQLTRAGLADFYRGELGHAGALVRNPGGIIEGAAAPRSDGCVAAL